MTDETFELLWNSFPDTELTDRETFLCGDGDRAASSVEKPANTGWRKQDDTTTRSRTTQTT